MLRFITIRRASFLCIALSSAFAAGCPGGDPTKDGEGGDADDTTASSTSTTAAGPSSSDSQAASSTAAQTGSGGDAASSGQGAGTTSGSGGQGSAVTTTGSGGDGGTSNGTGGAGGNPGSGGGGGSTVGTGGSGTGGEAASTATSTSTGSGGGDCGDLGEECCAADTCTAIGTSCEAGFCACALGFEDCGGGCVDLTSDAQHCGGCGRDCDGGSCGASRCQVEIIVDAAPISSSLGSSEWLDGYFTGNWIDDEGLVIPIRDPASGNPVLQRFDLDGEPGAVLTAPQPGGVIGPFLTDDSVFWVSTDTQTLRRVAKNGGAVATVWTGYATLMRVVDDYLYFVDNSGILRRVPPGTISVEMVTPAGRPMIVVDDVIHRVDIHDPTLGLARFEAAPIGGSFTTLYEAFLSGVGGAGYGMQLFRVGDVIAVAGVNNDSERVVLLDPSNSQRSVLLPGSGGGGLVPTVFDAGSWVYYQVGTELRRIMPNGSGDEQVAPMFATGSVVAPPHYAYMAGKVFGWRPADGVIAVRAFD